MQSLRLLTLQYLVHLCMFDQKLSGVPRQDLNPAVKSSAGADILMTGWVTEIARGELQGG